MCIPGVCKKTTDFVSPFRHLSYVKASKGETDVPDEVPEFIGQRRRWLNGSFAASLYSIMHFGRLYRSNHGFIRMFFLHIQLFYNVANIVFTWFSLASFFLTTIIVMTFVGKPEPDSDYKGWPFGNKWTPIFNVFIQYIYVALLILQFILALGNRPKGSKHSYKYSFIVFGAIQVYILVLTGYLVHRAFSSKSISEQISVESATAFFNSVFNGKDSVAGLILVALITVYGFNMAASLLYLDPGHMFHSLLQYMFLMSTYINILMVYSFNNWHDVSWGTKGSDIAEALPSAKVIRGESVTTVEENVKEQVDIDDAFAYVVERTTEKPKRVAKDKTKNIEDSYRSFRTWLVYLWLLSNVALVIFITSNSLSTCCEGVRYALHLECMTLC